MRLLRIVVVVVLILLLVVGTATAILGFWLVRTSFPQTDGSVRLAGLQAPVSVQRDAIGVPHITADNTEDLFFAHGYAHAQDRFYQMDVRRNIAAGRLSEMLGPQYLQADTFVRTLGWYRVAEQEFDLVSDESRVILQSYAAGVNAYLAGKRESELGLAYRMLGLSVPDYQVRQWDPVDSLAWLKALAWDLRQNMGNEIARVLAADAVGLRRTYQLFPRYPYDRVGTIADAADLPIDAPVGADGAVTEASAMLSPEAVQAFRNAAGGAEQLAQLLSPQGEGVGSNSWVVSGDLTETGKPLLANDPHLAPSIPGPWAQVGLRCRDASADCPYEVSGWSMPGLPGVLIGHNQHIAWGLTNLGADVTDLVLEKVQGDTYAFDGRGLPLSIRTESIGVAGADSQTIEIRETIHGPIISDLPQGEDDIADAVGNLARIGSAAPVPAPGQSGSADVPERDSGYAVALRWSGLEPRPVFDGIVGLSTASDWDSFRAAARPLENPALNLVYADVDGNIGYQAVGRIPQRQNYNGRWPVPGWDSSYDWNGYISFEDLPSVRNPTRGWLTTANQFAVPADSPQTVQTDVYAYGSRAYRIDERISESSSDRSMTAADMRQIQMDNGNELAAFLVPELIALRDRGVLDGAAAQAVQVLEGWDYQQSTDSAAAAFFNVFYREVLQRVFFDEISAEFQPDAGDRYWQALRGLWSKPEDPWWRDVDGGTEARDSTVAASLVAAQAEAEAAMGDNVASWRWGDLHQLPLEPVSAPITPQTPGLLDFVAGRAFDRGPIEAAGGGSIPNASAWDPREGYGVVWAPTMRQVVDLANFDASTWVNITGASGHPYHPNYADQIDSWAQGRQFSWPFSPTAVSAQAQQIQRLLPDGGPASSP